MTSLDELDFAMPFVVEPGEILSQVHTVAELLPGGYECYLRLFHPFVPWDHDDQLSPATTRTTWRGLAEDAGVAFTATTTWRTLAHVLPFDSAHARPWAVWEGSLEARAADALCQVLEGFGSGPFFFAFDLPAVIGTVDNRPRLFRSASLDGRRDAVERMRRLGAASIMVPEFMWQDDLRWVTCTNWDLTSTYVAADRQIADALLEHPDLEILEVARSTRIDDHADEQTD